ncbi:2Fe-2S iron-sulfur cluster-binding protein [Candidatus Chloroploca sp. Khr17]|uniref:2Fe-2S iron-sulfur cluster-binding protein n=1 Tax=Candidatus Chloroploca sp. Khr17 TaxID=2496869 RepID=UPI00101DAD93|nr:2Fe-2S iron-sulfur cluster-binding protein [Candidatus Chloroploca sp. Khr17]
MTTVIINDVPMEAKVGERVLNVARRNAAHIGFVCDNNGLCQTCRCQVLAGADQLNPPSEIELAWLTPAQLDDGTRLACQTVIRGTGEIRVESFAETMRRMALAVISPPRGTDPVSNLLGLGTRLLNRVSEQVVALPTGLPAVIERNGLRRSLLFIRDGGRYLDDLQRTVERLRTGTERLERRRLTADE